MRPVPELLWAILSVIVIGLFITSAKQENYRIDLVVCSLPTTLVVQIEQ